MRSVTALGCIEALMREQFFLATTHQVWGLCQSNLLSHQNSECGNYEPVGALWIYAIAVDAREQQVLLKVQWGSGCHTY